MKAALDFLLNGERVSLAEENPSRTLLTWLREARGLVGTKEGCAEGDCGACSVVLSDVGPGGKLRYQPVNACILCIGALEGKEVITVEGLKKGDRLHAVQQAMVDCHGSQCGFCTPGFVMALYAHCKSGAPPELSDAIAGNLCRCTGYRPILQAGKRARELADWQQEAAEDAARAKRIVALPKETTRVKGFFSPLSVAEFARYLLEHPKASVLAGGTDAGLWITKEHRQLDDIVYIGRVAELGKIEETPRQLEIGAAVTYAEAYEALERIHPHIGELLRRLGAVQVRAVGTLAGNIANGSPIGDSMPVLLALDATLTLQKGEAAREARLARFYTGYRKSVLLPGEFVRSIRVPKLAPGARFAAYKLSKRFDQDISSVCAAFHVEGNKARFGFGGMAATPARARQAEAAYAAKGIEAACTALVEDFSPISDPRASAWYRLRAAQALLRKFHAGASSRALLDMAP
ncbi:MAG TPA: xanthine dehydrogenase small subunit [Burkholderiales bacterium]|jgi:xanthine dehydrogenase small subunit|nr:xanthine dehydrogenase small subunit [Burkholderiales bacterium]